MESRIFRQIMLLFANDPLTGAKRQSKTNKNPKRPEKRIGKRRIAKQRNRR